MSDVVQSGICPSRGMLNMHCMSGVGVGGSSRCFRVNGERGPYFHYIHTSQNCLGLWTAGYKQGQKRVIA